MLSASFTAPFETYALGWSNKSAQIPNRMYLAAGSFLEEHNNKLQILSFDPAKSVEQIHEVEHQYPITSLKWQKTSIEPHKQLLATASDSVRIWQLDENENTFKAAAKLMRAEQYNSPLTGLDWNDTKPNLVLAASIDTTCAVWDASTQQIITQLIAHDKEVFDAGFQYGGTGDVFASTGKDGSVRTFDLRNLDHSTIIYETPDGSPLSRISWNSQDRNFMAILAVNSPKILILDIRSPSVPVMELHHGPGYPVNSCCWAPHSSSHLISVGDDSSAFVWELSSQSKKSYEAILEFQAEHEINNVCWSKDMPEWVAINYGNTLKALRID